MLVTLFTPLANANSFLGTFSLYMDSKTSNQHRKLTLGRNETLQSNEWAEAKTILY
jgi:hypothetical protein